MDGGRGATNGTRHGITEAAHRGDERTTLLGVLQRQRDLLAWKLRDAPDGLLRTAQTPSGLTLHGLVRHLTDAERFWLCEVVAGEPAPAGDPDAVWSVPPRRTVADLLEAYAAQCRRSDEVVAAAPSLDVVAAGDDTSLRWVLLHLVEETARHLGHVDLLREQVDGSTGDEPTG